MRHILLLGIMGILFFGQGYLISHAGHNHSSEQVPMPHEENVLEKNPIEKAIMWLGNLHLVFLHFPIALIIMTVVAELLFFIYGADLFNQASRFMIVAAAITVIPTVLFGFAYAYGVSYEGESFIFFSLHEFFGLLTGALTLLTAALKEEYVETRRGSKQIYYGCLFFAFITVNLAGIFGGILTFGTEGLALP